MNDFEELFSVLKSASQSKSDKPKKQIALLSAEIEEEQPPKKTTAKNKKQDTEIVETFDSLIEATPEALTPEQVMQKAKEAVDADPENFRAYAYASGLIINIYFGKEKPDKSEFDKMGGRMQIALGYIDKGISLLRKYNVKNPQVRAPFYMFSGNETEIEAKEKLMSNKGMIIQCLTFNTYTYIHECSLKVSDAIEKTVKASDDIKKKVKLTAKKAIRPQGYAKLLYVLWAVVLLAFVSFFVKTVLSYISKEKDVQQFFIYTLLALAVLIIMEIVKYSRYLKAVKAIVLKMSDKNKYLYGLKLGLVTSLLEYKKDYESIAQKAKKLVDKIFVCDGQGKVVKMYNSSYDYAVELYEGKHAVFNKIFNENKVSELSAVAYGKVKGVIISDDLKVHKTAIKTLNRYLK